MAVCFEYQEYNVHTTNNYVVLYYIIYYMGIVVTLVQCNVHDQSVNLRVVFEQVFGLEYL